MYAWLVLLLTIDFEQQIEKLFMAFIKFSMQVFRTKFSTEMVESTLSHLLVTSTSKIVAFGGSEKLELIVEKSLNC